MRSIDHTIIVKDRYINNTVKSKVKTVSILILIWDYLLKEHSAYKIRADKNHYTV